MFEYEKSILRYWRTSQKVFGYLGLFVAVLFFIGILALPPGTIDIGWALFAFICDGAAVYWCFGNMERADSVLAEIEDFEKRKKQLVEVFGKSPEELMELFKKEQDEKNNGDNQAD